MGNKTFTLRSRDLGGNFTTQQVMNSFGCQGDNISPQLYWENPPEGTRSFALIMHDADAPTASGFWHWAVFNIPADSRELPADAGNPEKKLLPGSAFMGKADTGLHAYGGPCPPEGDFTHNYIITLFALDTDAPEIDADTPLAQAQFKIVTQHELGRASIIAHHKR